MFNLKLVLFALFLTFCVFVRAQGEDNGAKVADLDNFKPEEVADAYGDLELARLRGVEEVKEAPRAKRACRPPTQKATSAPTQKATSAPTQKATTAPTSAPTQKATSAPTSAPTQKATSRPTTAPTQKATSAPTAAPTQKVTSAPTTGGYTGGLCDVVPATQQKLKILVPLYVYPGSAWDQVLAASTKADVIAIINPNNGPANGPDSSYTSYINKLNTPKVDLIGYVYTGWGSRNINDVKKDIDTYATKFSNIKGIFFDEASAEAKDIAYYTQLYNHVVSKGWKHSILNPGTTPAQGYVAISSSIVIFEESGSKLASINYPSWVTCAPNAAAKATYKYKFAGIAHSTSSSGYASVINNMQNKGFGLVYVTDGPSGCCTYNSLTTYMSNQASTVQSING